MHLESAGRLMDRAIEMFFAGEDPIFVLAMAHPASMLFHDLCRERHGDDNGLAKVARVFIEGGYVTEDGFHIATMKDFMGILRSAGNGLKHAGTPIDLRPDAEVAIMATGILEAEQLGAMTPRQLLFLNWLYATRGATEPELQESADAMFPGIKLQPLSEQLQQGLAAIAKL